MIKPDDIEERKPSKRQALDVQKCFFCDKGKEENVLHEVSTLEADRNIRAMVTELNDTKLLTRIVGGDLIAMEAKYHLPCLVQIRNQYRSYKRKSHPTTENTDEKMNESRAFVELTTHIEKSVDSGTSLFKLTDIHALYENRLKELGQRKEINKTRLKNQLLEHFPKVQEQNDGKNTVLVFQEGMKYMLVDALKKRDFDEDANTLLKAAKIVRKDIFDHESFQFSGSLTKQCQEKSIPSSLKFLISMILNGPNLQNQDKHDSQPCLTIGQCISYNMKKKSSPTSTNARHNLQREPPLPIYIGISLHLGTRSKKLINQLCHMGISISYDRVMQIEDQLATSACERFEEDGVVVPACLRKGLFTVGALDNLDHDPSSTTSVSSFHGTGISLLQSPVKDNTGESRPPLLIPPSDHEKRSLPHTYASVPAVAMKNTAVAVPKRDVVPVKGNIKDAKQGEYKWVKQALQVLEKELTKEDSIAWAAYHASIQPPIEDPPAICALLPLFYEKSATPAMIKHGMDIVRQAVEYLNPGQVPVTTFDQPLFAIAKLVQWKWPNTHGEGKHVVMLGGLHTEIALWKTLGDLLAGSGWITALSDADVATIGKADSFLKASHLTRTRHAHQVTLLTLRNLQQEAFILSSDPNDGVSIHTWRQHMLEKSPTFLFLDQIMKYETLVLLFIRAHRERNFPLYVEALEQLTPLFFALDHVNYARWVPVHLRDMMSLPAPIATQFKDESHWVINKTTSTFSAIPFDQAHEQENKLVKGIGGAVGLTENPTALWRWMLSGPELARLQKEFEEEYLSTDNDKEHLHHEQGLSAQKRFQKHVTSLSETVREMGNPFLDDFDDLVTLDSRSCTEKSAINTVRTLEKIGQKQYQEFVKKVLEERTVSIHEPIKRNSLTLFTKPKWKIIPKKDSKIKVLQSNVALFGQLYISMKSRESDLEEFFAHEIQSFPPSLSDYGKLHLPGNKSDLLKNFEQFEQEDPPSSFDCKVLDGAAIVHSLPANAPTFNEYADNIFIPYLDRQLRESHRLDVVWDTYLPDSLKVFTREKRGSGVRKKVSGCTKVPSNWNAFLSDPKNKQELFLFLTSKVKEHNWPQGKLVFATSETSVLSIGSCVIMPDCNHEEADTRIVVHICHALELGAKRILVSTVDTDVVVILLGKFYDFLEIQPSVKVSVAFGKGRRYRHYDINAIYNSLGQVKATSLPVFHAYSGCDTTSAFSGKGKKSAWRAWELYDEATEAFYYLARNPFTSLDENSEAFQRLERLTVLLYDKSSPSMSVNETRRSMFCQDKKQMDKLPPTQDALLQHVKRVIYQAGVWTSSHRNIQANPSPHEFGWEKVDGRWEPVWMTIPEVSNACRELIRCVCKGNCTGCRCGTAKSTMFSSLQM